ncbi:hypothetical protein J7E49_10780 [Variovorax paradoxus]|nr:hypothetical protein [Variovorax paradoxus]
MTNFTFNYHRNRWGDTQSISLTKTATGWHQGAIAYTGEMSPEGDSLFFGNFDQDMVNYPKRLGDFLGHIWRQLDSGEWSDAEAQKHLQALADWVSACERAEPKIPGWN